MKKNIFVIAAALTMCMAANSQEVMKVELKNGTVATYPVEDINRFYFEGAEQEEKLADFCDVEIEDEVVLNTSAVFKLSYERGVDHVIVGFLTEAQALQFTEEEILTRMLNGGGTRHDKAINHIKLDNLKEGTNYVFAYVGFNALDKRGHFYMHPFTTSVVADLLAKKMIATVTNFDYDSNFFYYTVEADASLVGEYYVLPEVGNDLTFTEGNMAAIGMAWKELMEEDEEMAGQHYFGDDFRESRPNGENSLRVMTWATDDEWELAGYIYEFIGKTTAGARVIHPEAKNEPKPTISAFSMDELLSQLRKSVKLYRVSKKQ